jgi:predicted acylesterase/phospholipase RssA
VINNLPADVMRQFGRGAVIACDVSSDSAMRADGVEGPDAEALARWRGPGPRPGLFDILLRSATLASESDQRSRAAHADCYIRMPTAGIGLFQWKALDRLAEAAYRHALDELRRFQPQLPPLARR